MKNHVLLLTKVEKAWIESYRKALDEKYPDSVHEMLIYGSKARGQAHAESDLDVLLIVKNKTGRLKRTLRRIGYLLAATGPVLAGALYDAAGSYRVPFLALAGIGVATLVIGVSVPATATISLDVLEPRG